MSSPKQESTENMPLSKMIELLKVRTEAFSKRFASLKNEYDELSDKRSDILQNVEQQRKELHEQTQKYQEAMKDYKEAEVNKVNAQIDIYLSLNPPNCLIYSPYYKSEFITKNISNHSISSEICSKICNELQKQYYSVIDNFLTDTISIGLYKEVKLMHMNDELKLGETGGGKLGKDERTNGKRFDMITYVDVGQQQQEKEKLNNKASELEIKESRSTFINFVDNLDIIINNLCNNIQELKDKTINRGNIMVSCYEKDAYYISHIDNPNGNGRILTALLYLNPSWKKHDGGQLQIHRCQCKTHTEIIKCDANLHNQHCIMIEPKWNRLVLFWSDKRNLHEVKASMVDRYAVSVWYLDVKESIKAQQQSI